jgi:hypothetical protein
VEPEEAEPPQAGALVFEQTAGFSEAGYSGSGGSYPPDFSGVSDDLDRESFSISRLKGKAKFTFTAAHALLTVAVIVFLVAVGLLIRRIVGQRRTTTAAATMLDGGSAQRDTQPARQPDRGAPDARAPRPRDPAQPPAGQLRVESDPVASVYVNQKLVGKTPASATVKPGSQVKLVVVARGHKMYRDDAVGIPQDVGVRVQAKLQKAGYKRATAHPRGLVLIRCDKRDRRRIALDGEDTGYTCPKVSFLLGPGRHVLGFYSIQKDKLRTLPIKLKAKKRMHIWLPKKW